jgi:formamidopyrimidine-DNA glycosylase
MPELPELVVMCEDLRARVVDRPISAARPYRPGILKTVEPPIEKVIGEAFRAVERRGKHLVLSLREDLHVVLHLMQAGRLILCKSGTAVTKATGFVLSFEDGEDLRLVENGRVKRAKMHLVADPCDVEWIAGAGPDALSEAFTPDVLREAVRGRRQQLKKVLTDQRTVAGIGTAYADEICFVARLSPIRYVSTLDDDEVVRLCDATREVLTAAIDEVRARSKGVLLAGHRRDFLRVYKKTGQPCPRCGTKIAEIRYAQKRTYYCPECQSAGRALPDRRAWLTR